jgi:hypothetical protein
MNTEMDRSSKVRSASGFIENLNVAVRENPVAATLIGVGVSWMFFRGSRMSDFGLAGASQKVARAVGSKAAGASKTVAAGFQAAGAGVSGLVQDVGETVASAARKATDFSNPVGDSSSVSRDGALTQKSGDDFLRSTRNTLAAALERQPLLLGAIGVAIGAGIGSTFASTQTENAVLGETGTAVKDQVRSMASDAADIARNAVETMTTEANAQGLTRSGLKAQAKTTGDKLKTVGAAARKSVKERLS